MNDTSREESLGEEEAKEGHESSWKQQDMDMDMDMVMVMVMDEYGSCMEMSMEPQPFVWKS